MDGPEHSERHSNLIFFFLGKLFHWLNFDRKIGEFCRLLHGRNGPKMTSSHFFRSRAQAAINQLIRSPITHFEKLLVNRQSDFK